MIFFSLIFKARFNEQILTLLQSRVMSWHIQAVWHRKVQAHFDLCNIRYLLHFIFEILPPFPYEKEVLDHGLFVVFTFTFGDSSWKKKICMICFCFSFFFLGIRRENLLFAFPVVSWNPFFSCSCSEFCFPFLIHQPVCNQSSCVSPASCHPVHMKPCSIVLPARLSLLPQVQNFHRCASSVLPLCLIPPGHVCPISDGLPVFLPLTGLRWKRLPIDLRLLASTLHLSARGPTLPVHCPFCIALTFRKK